MLTFVSGWRSPEREEAMIGLRDSIRPTLFFVDGTSTIAAVFADAPVIDLWRNGPVDFTLGPTDTNPVQVIRINHDTDNSLIVRAVSRALMLGVDTQIIVTFDAADALYRLFAGLRLNDAILAAESRLDASEGDHVVFTRGGSFMWTDHMLETQTAVLIGSETIDMGVMTEEMIADGLPSPNYRWSS